MPLSGFTVGKASKISGISVYSGSAESVMHDLIGPGRDCIFFLARFVVPRV